MEYPKLKPKGNVVLICGHVSNPNYQRSKWLVQNIIGKRLVQVFKPPHVCDLYDNDFRQQLWNFQHAIGGVFWKCRSEVLVFINGVYIGDDECLRHFLNINFSVSTTVPDVTSPQLLHWGEQDLHKLIAKDSARKYVFLDISIDGTPAGTLIIRLYVNICPHTCTHFLEYARITLEDKRDYGMPGYINTHIHRICRPSFLQAGDIQADIPIFSDESFDVLHNKRGVVSFSNIGPDTNKCQFIISLNPNPWMDRKYVAFGQVVEGMDVLDQIEAVPNFYESPEKSIEIVNCGELAPKVESPPGSRYFSRGISKENIYSEPSWDYYGLQSVKDETDTLMQNELKTMINKTIDETPVPVPDKVHPNDTPSDEMFQFRLEAGLYSLPKEYQVFVQNMKDKFRYKPDAVKEVCEKPSSATDVKQYYAMGDNEPPYAGLSENELQNKTDSEILDMFHDDMTDSDTMSLENMESYADLRRDVLHKTEKRIERDRKKQEEVAQDVLDKVEKEIEEDGDTQRMKENAEEDSVENESIIEEVKDEIDGDRSEQEVIEELRTEEEDRVQEIYDKSNDTN